MLRILRIEYKNLPVYDGNFAIDLFAADRVMKDEFLYRMHNTLYLQNLISFAGMNATGKTTALRLINLAMRIVINNASLNDIISIRYGMLGNDSEMIVTFCNDDTVYQLHSYFAETNTSVASNISHYSFKEEILKSKSLKGIKRRKDLLNFDDAKVLAKRSELDAQAKSVLKPDDSIVIMVTRDNDCIVQDVLTENYVNYSPMLGDTPSAVLNAFDENIEYLKTYTYDQDNHKNLQWVLKFKNNETVYRTDNPIELNRLISAGTIKGQTIIGLATAVLSKRGYLIVDELENHFNKEIVHVILDLFNNEKTNPRGACLIFTTHYSEILDFIDRKDNIYLTRKKNGLLSVSKLSNEINRNDIKKSELIISNYLHGTAPKYQQIKKLKDYVCRIVK
jgi:AAA15 family ATPase/GTPase